MIILLSPSKTINPKPAPSTVTASTPLFLEQAGKLASRVNALGRNLGKTLGVSEKIAQENRIRFEQWRSEPSSIEGSLAAWTYRGETYAGLSIESFDQQALDTAQRHLFIVSGLYGLLKPQDIIMPYRLEMSTKLKTGRKKNLYEFWGTTLADHIAHQEPAFVLNCASNEYSKSVLPHLPGDVPVITPIFLHNGKAKMVFAKFMRGTMARWAVQNDISDPKQIAQFNEEGYKYDTAASTPDRPVFIAPKDFSLKGRWTTL